MRRKPHVRLLLSGASFRRHRRAGRTGFSAQVEEQEQTPEQRILEVGGVEAPPEVALRLGVAANELVVVRRRLFLVNGGPVALCDSCYPGDMADGTPLAEPENIEGGADTVMEDRSGAIRRKLKRSVDDLVCRMPTPQEVEALELAPGVPVVRTLRTVYESDGDPVEVQETVGAADKHEFRYEVSMR